MSFFKREPEGPVARDWEGRPLTENQVLEIIRYINRISSGAYSYTYLKELFDLASNTFRKAYQSGDNERVDELGTELQVIEHVLKTSFGGRIPLRNLAPDPKHLQYLQYLDAKALAAVREMEERRLQEEALAANSVIIHPEQLEEIPAQEPTSSEYFPEEVTSAFYPLSSVPAIAKIQNTLKDLVYDLRNATEDNEPPFIIKQLERKIAQTHERLEEAKKALRRRLNPYYYY